MRKQKRNRHSELQKVLDENPFMSDEELARHFDVSIQTVRLDRMELGIPELRERVKMVAHDAFSKVRTLGQQELIGRLREIELGVQATSFLDITMDMIFEKTKIVRGHYIFAQANSLAVALVDAQVALTAEATVKYIRPVYAGERLLCTAKVSQRLGKRVVVDVQTTSGETPVFSGRFSIAIIREGEYNSD